MVSLAEYLILGRAVHDRRRGRSDAEQRLILFMSLELMLNAVNLTFVAFSRYTGRLDGHVFVFLVTAVAAAEAPSAGIFVSLFRLHRSVDVDELNAMGTRVDVSGLLWLVPAARSPPSR